MKISQKVEKWEITSQGLTIVGIWYAEVCWIIGKHKKTGPPVKLIDVLVFEQTIRTISGNNLVC